MAKLSAYKTEVDMKLILNNKETIIPSESIVSIIVDHDFEGKTMPVIYAKLVVNTTLYNQLVLNAEEGKIYLNTRIYDAHVQNSIRKNNIKGQFIYFIPKSASYIKELQSDKVNLDNSYNSVTIGMMKVELLNYNKQSYNGIYRNTDSANMLNMLTQGRPLSISPLSVNKKYNEFFMPPKSSRSTAIDYLFSVDPFYESKYNYFTDFDRSYITNYSPTRKDKKSNEMKTVVFDIRQITMTESYYEGMTKDLAKNCYLIYVNVADSNISVNNATDKNTNQIVGVDEDGVTITDLNLNKSKFSTTKQIFTRTDSTQTNVAKSEIESTGVLLSLTKQNIDASILTPDKIYLVNNYNDYEKYNGKFVIMYKKEIIVKVDNSFTSTTVVGLRRLADQ